MMKEGRQQEMPSAGDPGDKAGEQLQQNRNRHYISTAIASARQMLVRGIMHTFICDCLRNSAALSPQIYCKIKECESLAVKEGLDCGNLRHS